MKKYIDYINEFHSGNSKEIEFINNQLKKHLSENKENQTEIETILDYLFSNPKVNISKIGYKTILEKTEKWHKKLQLIQTKDNEEVGVDYEIVLDFKDGFKFVKLISQDSYNREGKLMSHCVASYFGRDVEIFSLRDEKNKPHCTIEEGQQIKGKGNGSIDPKYVDYVVKFLEHLGMKVGENEMKNLGYYKLQKIDKDLTSDSLFNGYIYENKLDTIKDKDGNQYQGFGLLNIKKLVEIKGDFSLKWNFDFSLMINYFLRKIDNQVNISNKSYSTAVANESSSTAVARGIYSIAVARGIYSTAVANESSSTAVTNDYSSIAVANEYYSTAIANESSSTAVTRGSSSTAVANGGKNCIALVGGYNSKAKGKKGAWLILTEYDTDNDFIIDIKSKQIDGLILKEDVFYKLEKGEFVEIV